jgi:hypothetical protein
MFVVKGSGDVKLNVIIPSNDEAFIQKLFSLSDQSENYDLKLVQTDETPSDIETPYVTYNDVGDVVTMETFLGRILTFKNNKDNVQQLFGDNWNLKSTNQNSNTNTWVITGPPVQEADGLGTKRTTSQVQTKPDLL